MFETTRVSGYGLIGTFEVFLSPFRQIGGGLQIGHGRKSCDRRVPLHSAVPLGPCARGVRRGTAGGGRRNSKLPPLEHKSTAFQNRVVHSAYSIASRPGRINLRIRALGTR